MVCQFSSRRFSAPKNPGRKVGQPARGWRCAARRCQPAGPQRAEFLSAINKHLVGPQLFFWSTGARLAVRLFIRNDSSRPRRDGRCDGKEAFVKCACADTHPGFLG